MVKQGPCGHCGVTSTPLWRNGPPEKPVLCNACGSRWRTKGSLTNYTPLHAREPIDSDGPIATKMKCTSLKSQEQSLLKKTQLVRVHESEIEMPFSGQNFQKIVDKDTSNRSSSGLAISYSESCAHVNAVHASDVAGSAQSDVRVSLVPSKKRTCVTHPKPSAVEELTKELHSIMQEQQLSCLSGSSEDLLYLSQAPTDSFDIGYGSVLIRNPNSESVEEESEASSIPSNNKLHITNEAHSGSAVFSAKSGAKGSSSSNADTAEYQLSTALVAQDNAKRDKLHPEKLKIMQDRNSPLTSIDLKDIITSEAFQKLFTYEEQQHLSKYLPSVDTENLPNSIERVFKSSQFVEAFSCFQKLLREGIFGISFLGANAEGYRTLKRLVLGNLTKSSWVECYEHIRCKNSKKMRGKEMVAGKSAEIPIKRPRDHKNLKDAEFKVKHRSPKRAHKSGGFTVPSESSSQLNCRNAASESANDSADFTNNQEVCIGLRSFYACPPETPPSTLDSLQFTDGNDDHDLLLDVPCNAAFPEAELLYPSFQNENSRIKSSPSRK